MSLFDAYEYINNCLEEITDVSVNKEISNIVKGPRRVIYTAYQGPTSFDFGAVSKVEHRVTLAVRMYSQKDGAKSHQQVLAELYSDVVIKLTQIMKRGDRTPGLISVLPAETEGIIAFQTDQEEVSGSEVDFTVKYRETY